MTLSPFNEYIRQTIQHRVPMKQSYEYWIRINGKGIVGFAEKMGWMRDTQELMALLINDDAKSYLTGIPFPLRCPHCSKIVLAADDVGKNLTDLFLSMGGDIAQAEYDRLQRSKQYIPKPARTYDCPTCGQSIKYLQTSCTACGNGIVW